MMEFLKPTDTSLLEEKTEKSSSNINIKYIVIGVIACIICIVLGLALILHNHKVKVKDYQAKITDNYNSVCVDWIYQFSQGNIQACDNYILKATDRINYITDTDNYEYYEYAMQELGKSITDIEVIDTSNNTYTLQISYKPFVELNTLEVDEETQEDFAELRQQYIDGEVGDSEVQSKIKELYYNVYVGSCFNTSDTISTKVLTLSEETEDGVTYVQGTVSFIDDFLSDSNLSNNLNNYENQIKQLTQSMIQE